jgi:peptidoglycan/LPS O-acetylase OafA/YrhL
MWTTNNYFLPAIIGLALSDIAAHGHFARIRNWPFMRTIAIHIVLLAIALAFQFVNPLRDNVNKGLAVINVTNHDEIQICDVIFVACIFLIFETSKIAQVIFGNIVMRMLGKLAPGMYLLCAPITFTVVPSLAVSLSNNGTSGSGILGVTWVVCFAISVIAAIPFHFLVELPSKLAGEYTINFLEKWGRTEEERLQMIKGPEASKAPKKIAGPGAK